MAKYEYDGLNRRDKAHIDSQSPGNPDGVDHYRHFFYNAGWQILETRDADDVDDEPEDIQPEYQYVWSLRYIDAPVLRDKNTDEDDLCDDQRLYFTNDANMNVTALVGDDGTVLERYLYDPYGKVTVLDPDFSADADGKSDYDNNILFCGYYYDWETGLYNVRRRPYHPPLGRMPSRDPVESGMNLYEYAGSAPVLDSDPYGLMTEEECKQFVQEMKTGGALFNLYWNVKLAKGGPWPFHEKFCLDDVKCKCCEVGWMGWYEPYSRDLTLCYNNLMDEQEATEITYHELIHAYSICGKPISSCKQCMIEEKRAYYLSGSCHDKRSCTNMAWDSCCRGLGSPCFGKNKELYQDVGWPVERLPFRSRFIEGEMPGMTWRPELSGEPLGMLGGTGP